VCSKSSQRAIEELRKNVADLETRLRNETSRIKTRYETQFHEFEMQADVLSRSNAELTKNNKGLLTKIKVTTTTTTTTTTISTTTTATTLLPLLALLPLLLGTTTRDRGDRRPASSPWPRRRLSRVWLRLRPVGCTINDDVCGVHRAEKTTRLFYKQKCSYSRRLSVYKLCLHCL